MATLHEKRMYEGVFIGAGIRRDIGQSRIYRIRRGNGLYGAELGEVYQDNYTYFVPSSITHANGNTSRTCFTNAVATWHTLSDSEKDHYDHLAMFSGKPLSGFNLFISRYMVKNY